MNTANVYRANTVEMTYRMESGGDVQAALCAANGFTVEEMTENRLGRIAPTQVPRLIAAASQPFIKALMVVGGWLIFLMIIYTFIPSWLLMILRRIVPILGFSGLAITLSVGVALLCGFFKSAWTFACLALDLNGGTPVCVEARVSTSMSTEEGKGMDRLHGDRDESHFYVVSNIYVPVTRGGYEAFREYSGSTCKVYMTQRSQLLLAIEPTKLKRA